MKLLFISVECWTWHSTRKHQHDTNEIVCVCAQKSVRVKSLSSRTSSSFHGLVIWCKFLPFSPPSSSAISPPSVCSLFPLSSPPAALPSSHFVYCLFVSFANLVCSLILPPLRTQISPSPNHVVSFSCKPLSTSFILSLFLAFCLTSNPLFLPPIPPSPCPLSCVTNNSNLNIKG